LNFYPKVNEKDGTSRLILYLYKSSLAWYAEFLLEIDLKILLRKTGARLIFKIALISLHIDPGHND
jgi:hypothetical protein